MDKKVVIFGCGRLGHEAVNVLGEENIECFCDNNPSLIGNEKYGKIIISFKELKEKYSDAVILICADIKKRNAYAIARQCEENGLSDYLFYESIRTMGFSSGQEILHFLENPLNRMALKCEIYMKKTMELQQQVDYFKEHADIRSLKPAKGKLRERQLDIVRVAAEFLENIKELEIQPFLYGGNLIGYVRHNGFIPWDDDIDFALMRDGYEKLREYCRQHVYTEEEFYAPKKTEKEVQDEMKKFYWGYNGGDEFNIYRPFADGSKIVIDFFVLDYYSDNYSFNELMELAREVRERLNDFMFDNEARKEYFSTVRKENEQHISKESNKIYFGIDNMEIMHRFHRGSWIPQDVVFPLKKVLFEGTHFWVPNDAEEFLKYEYENIWTFPEDVGIAQHMYNVNLDVQNKE